MKSDRYEQQQDDQPDFTITVESLTIASKQLMEHIQQNTNLRMKYADDPEKFYQSQEEIHAILQKLSELSLEHIDIIISSHLSQPLLKLLTHPNIDLSIEVIELLYELLQEQPQDDKLFEIYYRWVVWMVDNSCVQALVNILTKLDEQNNIEEYQAGLKCIKLIEICANITDQVYDILAQDKQLFEYLANRIMPNFLVKHKIIDDNKYASSDILVGLLSNSEKSQHLFSQFSGVEVLLECIAGYEGKLPGNQDQKEFLNNLFTSLSILLTNHLLPQNKRTYTQMKGNYLMISFLRMKNEYSPMALKCIANSLNGLDRQQEKEAVQSFVNDGGLKYLFAVLRRKGIRGEDVDEQKVVDQNVVAVVYCLVRSTEGVVKDRVEYKLAENRFENLERLFQVRSEYLQAVDAVAPQPSTIHTESTSTSLYLTKLSQGLSLIQGIDKTLLILTSSFTKLRPKLMNLYKIYGIKYEMIEKTIKDHYQYIGMKEEKAFVEGLLAGDLLGLKRVLAKIEEDEKQEKQKETNNKHQVKQENGVKLN